MPAELPDPPVPRGMGWFKVVGPGVIVLGLSLGGGEFLLGPTAFVRYGLSLLWITLVSVFLQTIFNTELMRYTLATGEPAFTGHCAHTPCARILVVVLRGHVFAAGRMAVFRRAVRRRDVLSGHATGGDAGRRRNDLSDRCRNVSSVHRAADAGTPHRATLELLNWVMVVAILGGFFLLGLYLVPGGTWIAAVTGLFGFDLPRGRFSFVPNNADFLLLAALADTPAPAAPVSIALSSWARDKGYGMGQRVGYIPAAVGGHKVKLAHTG